MCVCVCVWVCGCVCVCVCVHECIDVLVSMVGEVVRLLRDLSACTMVLTSCYIDRSD